MQDAAEWSEEEGAPPAPQYGALLQAVRGAREAGGLHAAGDWLAGGEGRAVVTWRWARGEGWREEAREGRAHRLAVRAVRWGAGGAALLATGGAEGAVRVWSRRLAGRGVLAAAGAGGVRALCWAGGGRLLAAHDCGALCVWGVWGGARLLARLLPAGGALYAVAAPAGGALLLTGCGEGTVKLYDMEAVVAAGVEGAAPPPLSSVECAHDLGTLCAAARERGGEAGALLATGGQDARVLLWHAGRGGLAPAGRLQGQGGAVTALAWAGDRLVSAAADGGVRVWSRGSCVLELRAHARYCAALCVDEQLRYIVTGSSDRWLRTWSLGVLSLDDDLEPRCAALEHFALGDLQGIGPVETGEEDGAEQGDEEARCVWTDEGAAGGDGARHGGAINCIAAHDDRIATACSDGMVRIYRWREGAEAGGAGGQLSLQRAVAAHGYPAAAADWGAGGALLLSAGLDGRATLWDPDTGAELRSLEAAGVGGEAAGVRGARVSGGRPPLLLLAADDGRATLWELAATAHEPLHVYEGHVEGALCCGWARGGGMLAVGGAGGELRLHAPPPRARLLHLETNAHDLGVQTLDWLESAAALAEDDECCHLLATGGSDEYLTVWLVRFREHEDEVASVRLAWRAWAHGGGVAVVRGGRGGALVASGGADRWARVWRAGGGELRAVPAPGRQMTSLAWLGALLVLGSLDGRLAVWSAGGAAGDEEPPGPRGWGARGVARWLMDHGAEGVVARARGVALTGARLLDDSLEELLQVLCGDEFDEDEADVVEGDEAEATGMGRVRACLREELLWLRVPPPPLYLSRLAPHSLLCPLSHRLLSRPVRAADGFSYDCAALLEWLRAEEDVADPTGVREEEVLISLNLFTNALEDVFEMLDWIDQGININCAVSPVSGRAMHGTVEPNRRLTITLRQFLRAHGAGPPDYSPTAPDSVTMEFPKAENE